jgi:hypothetical protein
MSHAPTPLAPAIQVYHNITLLPASSNLPRLSHELIEFGIAVFGSAEALRGRVLDNAVSERVVMRAAPSEAKRLGHNPMPPTTATIVHMAADEHWHFGVGDQRFVQPPRCDAACQAELEAGGVMVEVGANIGMLTVYATLRWPRVRTVAVEASPTNVFLHKW